MLPSWETIQQFATQFGLLKAVFVLFFFMAHFWVHKMYEGRLEDRQKEIDRLAEDNHKYRDRFLHFIDQKIQFPAEKPKGKRRAS